MRDVAKGSAHTSAIKAVCRPLDIGHDTLKTGLDYQPSLSCYRGERALNAFLTAATWALKRMLMHCLGPVSILTAARDGPVRQGSPGLKRE